MIVEHKKIYNMMWFPSCEVTEHQGGPTLQLQLQLGDEAGPFVPKVLEGHFIQTKVKNHVCSL